MGSFDARGRQSELSIIAMLNCVIDTEIQEPARMPVAAGPEISSFEFYGASVRLEYPKGYILIEMRLDRRVTPNELVFTKARMRKPLSA